MIKINITLQKIILEMEKMSEFGGMVKSDGDITCGRTKEILKP
jgi:hypothetical protein